MLVRSSGFEPPRSCERQPLKLVRLPVPPRPRRVNPKRRGFRCQTARRYNLKKNYLFGGTTGFRWFGTGTGCEGGPGTRTGGADFAGAFPGCCVCSKIEPVPACAGARLNDSVRDVIMKTMAHQVVARERNVAAPRGPKAV